jgi:hypothetical protein
MKAQPEAFAAINLSFYISFTPCSLLPAKPVLGLIFDGLYVLMFSFVWPVPVNKTLSRVY